MLKSVREKKSSYLADSWSLNRNTGREDNRIIPLKHWQKVITDMGFHILCKYPSRMNGKWRDFLKRKLKCFVSIRLAGILQYERKGLHIEGHQFIIIFYKSREYIESKAFTKRLALKSKNYVPTSSYKINKTQRWKVMHRKYSQ